MEIEWFNPQKKWIGLNPSCPEFVPQQQSYMNAQPPAVQTTPGWIARGQTTWQYDVFTNRVVGGYYPRIRTKGAYLYDLDAVAFDPNIDVPIKVCFNCWQTGHPQQKCPQPKSHIFCDNCGRMDITVNECPRCARAYNRFLLEQQARKDIGMQVEDEDFDKEGLGDSFEMDDIEKIENSERQSTLSSVASQTAEEVYFSHDGSESLDSIIIDETLSSQEPTSNFLRDFMILMDSVKNLPMETQNDVVQQFLAERRLKLMNGDKEKDV